MCELFAMSSLLPATVSFSLERFARRGGVDGPHRDGWGIAYHDDRDACVTREPRPAATSALVRFIEENPPRSTLVLSHIRRATQGAVALRNTQPFARELGGRVHVFAHNGDLGEVTAAGGFPLGRFRPVGDTDSERAFCALLARLERLWLDAAGAPPPLGERLEAVAEFAAAARSAGPANFLYADGDALFIHADRRRHEGGEVRPPGLHVVERRCEPEGSPAAAEAGFNVSRAVGEQKVLLAASVPLSGEAWRPLARGEILAVAAGEVVHSCGAGANL